MIVKYKLKILINRYNKIKEKYRIKIKTSILMIYRKFKKKIKIKNRIMIVKVIKIISFQMNNTINNKIILY